MYCTACGKKIPDAIAFCTFCGARQPQAAAVPPRAPAPVPPPARPRAHAPGAAPRAAAPGAAASLISALTLPELLVIAGSLLAIVGFFLPAWSLTTFITAQVPTPLYDPGNTWASGAPNLGSPAPHSQQTLSSSTTSTPSLLSLTHSSAALFLLPVLALAAVALVLLSRHAARAQKILASALELAIGSMLGPASLLALLFFPSVRDTAAAGFWVLSLGFCAIAAGGFLGVMGSSKSPS